MLTIEMLRQSSDLVGLTDAQLSAIAEMSKNDENVVIGAKIGALHGQYDNDILGITGVKKKDGEKSYDYAKRVLGEYKAKVDSVKTIQNELTASKAQIVELQTKLEKNTGDETLRQQLKDTKTQVAQLQTQLQTKEAEFNSKKAEYENAVKNIHADYAFQSATSGLKFKAGITDPIKKVLLSSAKAEILSKGTPDFIDDGAGGKKLVLRGSDGNILNNPKNNLNPYTFEELVLDTSLKDAIDTGVRQTGGGTGNIDTRQTSSSGMLDLSGIKSQVEADKAIEAHLLANGLTRDSQEFANQSLKLRSENNVESLPIK